MIASRQCFGNCIRIRRHILPKELAEFWFFKDAFQDTPEQCGFGSLSHNGLPCVFPSFVPLIIYYSGQKTIDLSLFLKGSQERTSSYALAKQSIKLFSRAAKSASRSAPQNIQKNRLPSIDFCHFWRYNENTCE